MSDTKISSDIEDIEEELFDEDYVDFHDEYYPYSLEEIEEMDEEEE